MPEHPSGTVTFLFTDIEGSTHRWEVQPAVMAAAVARHDALLRQAMEAQAGYIFKTVGDAFCTAFATAPAALAAALAAQQALAAASWDPALDGLRVRMGLHTGAAEERDGDYFGPAVNRVARLTAAAAGGQVVLSQATQELLRARLPAGVELRDLGTHRLKDLIRPEQIFQVLAPGLPADFPPLQTLDGRRHNLPRQPTALIGREPDLAAALALLRQPATRLVTLLGPGGTGKTRLALQLAAELLDAFPDGAWFVDLAPLVDPALVLPTIAAVLGVKDTAGAPLLDTLQDALRPKQLLLVLDNVEQVVAAAPQAGRLLAGCPRLQVLATSRIALQIQGEHTYAVPPLALPDLRRLPPATHLTQYAAVRLFVERAQAVQAGFALTPANASAVAAICVRLDGLPLAIELAAARTRLLPPAALLARLDRRLPLLTGGGRDVTARQQTLRGAIDWSYDLLAAAEQQLFRQLAVFVGGWTLDAVAAVCYASAGRGGDVLDGVEALLNQSLLRQEDTGDGEPRMLMLETIHEYAREKLDASGEAAALDRRQADYFLALAEAAAPALSGPAQQQWLAQLEQEHDNLRAALRWALSQPDGEQAARLAGALWPFWDAHGHWQEGQRWLEAVLAHPHRASGAVRARLLQGAATLAYNQGDLAAASPLFAQSLALWREVGDPREIAAVLYHQGLIARALGELGPAQAFVEESLGLLRGGDDPAGRARALTLLGHILRAKSDPRAAQARYTESLALFRQAADTAGIARMLYSLGNMARELVGPQAAELLYAESLALQQALGEQRGIANTLEAQATTARDQGTYGRAAALYTQALELQRRLNNSGAVVSCLVALGALATDEGQWEQARALLEDGLSRARQLNNQWLITASLENLAELAHQEGQREQAHALFTEALTRYRQLDNAEGIAISLRGLGQLALQAGAWREAAALFQESLALLREREFPGQVMQAVSGVIALLGAREDWAAAARVCGVARGLQARYGPRLRARVQEVYAQVEAHTRQHLAEPVFQAAVQPASDLSLEEVVSAVSSILAAVIAEP